MTLVTGNKKKKTTHKDASTEIAMPMIMASSEGNAGGFSAYVDEAGIKPLPETPAKKAIFKSYEEVKSLIDIGRKSDAKQIIRETSWPLENSIRTKLWLSLCLHHTKDALETGYYWEIVKQLYGTTDLPDKPLVLPPFLEQGHCLGYHLSRKGRLAADRVVCVLGYSWPDITYSPAIYPIAALLLHYLSEEDCYNCLVSLVRCKEKVFFTQTKLLNEVTWRTVMQIAKKHVKAAAVNLARHCNNSVAERIYSNWIWWVLQGLPFPHLVRVLDCFFNEGIKVLYRVAMAILLLFHKTSSQWADDVLKNGVEVAFNRFCQEIPVAPSKILKTAFKIRGLSSVYIQRIFLRTEMSLKSRNNMAGTRQMTRSRSSDNLPTNQSQMEVQVMSHTLTIREEEELDPQRWTRSFARQNSLYRKGVICPNDGARSPVERVASQGFYPVHKVDSKVLDHDELLALWQWLPVRITMYQPVLLYTTEEHGCSLTTFYHRVDNHEPTLLMIKTLTNEVFGAYCSTRWGERNAKDHKGHRQAYFGTGETFLFSLYPERAKYPWVGTQQAAGDNALDHSAELFMAADAKMLTIGGGGSQALWMDENVRFGKTDSCKTFNNPPLCANGDFEIKVLEVYGFACE